MDQTVLIGKKPAMNYATSAMIIAQQSDEIVLKARGKAIQRAVDVSQLILRRFLKNTFEITMVKLGTEEIDGDFKDIKTGEEYKKKINVSTIEIKLEKI